MTEMNPKLLHVPRHGRDKMIGSPLADNLREQYGRRSVRVVKDDSVKVLRGEYKGIEGKVNKVNIEKGTLEIEGIQREKVRGGNVKVPIHSSNVIVVGLNLNDKYRLNKLQGGPKSSADKEEKKAKESKVEEKEKKSEKE